MCPAPCTRALVIVRRNLSGERRERRGDDEGKEGQSRTPRPRRAEYPRHAHLWVPARVRAVARIAARAHASSLLLSAGPTLQRQPSAAVTKRPKPERTAEQLASDPRSTTSTSSSMPSSESDTEPTGGHVRRQVSILDDAGRVVAPPNITMAPAAIIYQNIVSTLKRSASLRT